jgi:hypothetical protein
VAHAELDRAIVLRLREPGARLHELVQAQALQLS